MPLIAGVDSSTQSTKVVLCDADSGVTVGSGSAPHPIVHPPCSEQHPNAWWEAFVDAWHRALGDADARGADVRAISVGAQCHGLVVLDAKDRVIRPAKLWNDTTSAPEMEQLRAWMAPAEWARRTGSVPTGAFTVSKLLWLARHEPDAYAQVVHVLLPHDWLTFRLTGRYVTDRSDASGTGYFDAEAGRYVRPILDAIDPSAPWEDRLPTVLGPTEPAGTVTAQAAAALGTGRETMVGPGAGDQHASALGLGARVGDRVLSLGTSGVLFAVTRTSVHDPLGMVDGVADAAGGYLPLVSTLNAARVTDTFARVMGVDRREFDRLALSAAAGEGPVLAAYLDGERKPDLPRATGTLAGIRTDLSREQLARAAVEGVVFGLRRGADHLDRVGVPSAGRLIVTGGAARSAAYRQITADAFDVGVHTSPAVESVAVGAAIQAKAVLSGLPLESVRDEWAPVAVPGERPRDPAKTRAAYQRYVDVAEWRGTDIAG